MSKLVHQERIEAHPDRDQKRHQGDVATAAEQIDSTIEHLRDRIIPLQPYLLSVPSDVPYRHSSKFVNTWYIGTPFSAEEEQLQYLSFFSHQGEEDSLLRVVGGWADDRGNLLEDDTTSPISLSGQNTPIEQSSRKKISLKDYKTKDKTRPSTPTTKAPAQPLRKQVMKSEAKDVALNVEEGKEAVKARVNPGLKTEKHDTTNRDRSQVDGVQSPAPSSDARKQDAPSPRKRRRISSDELKKGDATAKKEKPRELEDTKGLPSLLSPTLPAQPKGRYHKDLPGLLLPDLPPALEKLVAKADNKLKTDPQPVARTEQVKTILGHALGTTASKRPPEKSPNDTNTLRIRSDSQASLKAAVVTPKVQSPAIKPALKTIPRPITPLQNGNIASPKPRQRHTVVLRYGKKNRKRVEALLKFASRPKKIKAVLDEPASKTPEVRPALTKSSLETSKLERKRPPETSPERPAKKPKQLETPEKSKFASLSAAKSPANIPSASKAKTDIVTPKKELKSTAMRRIESQDGGDVRTPQGDRARTSTPSNTAASSQTKPSPGPSSSVSKEERAGWQELNSKCFTLGRTLKHEGTSLGPSPSNERSEKDQVLSVILLIEALLCFIVNHAAQSQARPGVDPGWSTILPYHIFVHRASRKYRHLHGLVIQLGAVCRQAINNYNMERLQREPLPFEHFESAPTPGSDGTTKQIDDVDNYKKKYITFRDQLVVNAKELQSAWLEGSRYLPLIHIERDYPKTWAKRIKDTSKRGTEKLRPDALGKDYYLPLDTSSNAFEATRFSLSFLREWSDKEKIEWKPRIEI